MTDRAHDKSSSADLPSVANADRSKPYIPLSGLARDGHSNSEVATATCFCGAVQLEFPLTEPGLVGTFICHCSDCRKLTASIMGTSGWIAKDNHVKHLRGEELLTTLGQKETIAAGNTMRNSFCSKCGILMYRRGTGFPGLTLGRIGTVDDFNLAEGVLRPRVEQFVKDRPSFLKAVDGAEQFWAQAPAKTAL